jgi:hypothetical protein
VLQLAVIIELITVSSGSGVRDAWGECALRVIDQRDGSDQLYGHTREKYGEWARRLPSFDRAVTHRELAMPGDSGGELADRLKARAELDPRALADELDAVLRGALSRGAKEPARNSLRALILEPIRPNVPLFVAVDLGLTVRADQRPSEWETRFLCEELAGILDRATLLDGTKFVSKVRDTWVPEGMDRDARWSWPWIIVYVFLIAPLVVLAFVRPRAAEVGWAILGGVLGTIFILLAIFGGEFFSLGFNVAIFPPTHFVFLNPRFRFARTYWIAHAVLLALLAMLLFGSGLGPAIGAALPVTIALAIARTEILGVSHMRRMP